MKTARWIRASRAACVLAASATFLALHAPAVQAQRAWGPTLREASANVESRALWRGHDLGSPGFRASLSVPIFGHTVAESPRPTRWGVTVDGALLAVGTSRAGAPAGSHGGGALALSRLLAGSETVIELIGAAYSALETGDTRAEAGFALRRVRLPVFGEPDLMLDITVLHDPGDLDGTYGSLGLGTDLNPPMLGQRLLLLLTTRLHADDYAATGGGRAVEAGAGVRVLLLAAGARNLSAALDGGVLAARARRAVGVASFGLVLR